MTLVQITIDAGLGTKLQVRIVCRFVCFKQPAALKFKMTKCYDDVVQQLCVLRFPAMQGKLNEEKCARQKAELHSQEKERQISMLSVDYRQIQQRLQKLEGEHRQVHLQFMFTFFCFVIFSTILQSIASTKKYISDSLRMK